MRTFDFTPLFRSTVGFDHLASLLDAAMQTDESTVSYPPYNIEKLDEDKYRITMAVAGFTADDLDIETRENLLVVRGRKETEEGERTYLHRGIGNRSFERRFQLADFVKVAEANLDNGLLRIDLVREIPEEMKPRRIEIATSEPRSIASKAKKLVGEGKQAA